MAQATYIIDFDSTIVRCESLEELARFALYRREDREIALRQLQDISAQGMAGSLPFDVSLRRRLELFIANRDHLDQLTAYLKREITSSVLRQRDWFKQNREHIFVLSGGFEEYIVPVVAELGIAADHVWANAFRFDRYGGIIGYDTGRHLAQAGGKVRQVATLELSHPVIAIGDGYTDYEIRAAGVADEFWAFCENITRPSVTAGADRVLTSFDEVVESSDGLQ